MLKPAFQRAENEAESWFQHLTLVAALAAQRCSHKPAKQRMRVVWPRIVFRMELRRQEPGVIFQFDDLDESAVRRQST